MRASIIYSTIALAATALAAPVPGSDSADAIFARGFEAGLQARDGTDKPLPELPKPLPARPLTTDDGDEEGFVTVHGDKPAGGNAPAGAQAVTPSMRNGEGSTRVQKVTNAIKKKVGH
jgi:hypothetical protein